MALGGPRLIQPGPRFDFAAILLRRRGRGQKLKITIYDVDDVNDDIPLGTAPQCCRSPPNQTSHHLDSECRHSWGWFQPWHWFWYLTMMLAYMRGLGVCQLQLAIIVGIDRRKWYLPCQLYLIVVIDYLISFRPSQHCDPLGLWRDEDEVTMRPNLKTRCVCLIRARCQRQ